MGLDWMPLGLKQEGWESLGLGDQQGLDRGREGALMMGSGRLTIVWAAEL